MEFISADDNINNLVGKKWDEVKQQKREWRGAYPLIDCNNTVIDIVDMDGNGILDFYRKNSEIFYLEADNCYYTVDQDALKRRKEEN